MPSTCIFPLSDPLEYDRVLSLCRYLVQALTNHMSVTRLNHSDVIKPIRIIISLLDRVEIGLYLYYSVSYYMYMCGLVNSCVSEFNRVSTIHLLLKYSYFSFSNFYCCIAVVDITYILVYIFVVLYVFVVEKLLYSHGISVVIVLL